MTSVTTQDIELSRLVVNTENPRFEILANQREAIDRMLSDQGQKIVNLARDIVENGVNPSELTIVSPLASEKGMFNVLEGNRRVTALKLLDNPGLAEAKHKVLINRIKKLTKKPHHVRINSITCVVYTNPEDAYRWIKLKHTGENEGIGTVRWDAQQVARFDERIEGKSAVALQALDFLKKSEEVPSDLKPHLNSIPLTNLDRLITDRNVQEVLGVSIENGRLCSHLPESELIKGFSKILRDMTRKQDRLRVKDIYTKKDREKYIETFHAKDIPKKTSRTSTSWELASQTNSEKRTRSRSIPLSTTRKGLIPRDCILQIKEKRINAIYTELKRLDCDDYTNAASVLFRVFIELSADAYLAQHKIGQLTRDSKLAAKLGGICDELLAHNALDKHQAKGIRTAISNKDSLVAVDTFNSYVHNLHLAPIPRDLKTTWDNIQPFINALWENI